jgi:hypothetical protein
MIYGFCSYIKMDPNSTLQISKIHDNFSLDPFSSQEVTGETLNHEPEKRKFSKFSISNQISREGYIFKLWVFMD